MPTESDGSNISLNRLVSSDYQPGHKTAGFGLTYQRVLIQLFKLLREIGSYVVLDARPTRFSRSMGSIFASATAQATAGVAAVGVTVVELTTLFDQYPGNAVTHHHTPGDITLSAPLAKVTRSGR